MNRSLLIPCLILPALLLAACTGPGPISTPAPVVVVLGHRHDDCYADRCANSHARSNLDTSSKR